MRIRDLRHGLAPAWPPFLARSPGRDSIHQVDERATLTGVTTLQGDDALAVEIKHARESRTAVAAGLAVSGVRPSRSLAQAGKLYSGTRLKVSQVSHAYAEALQARLPAFEQQTGIKVEIDQMSFPVLNQREDLELASGSGAYDVMQMIFIRSGRWIAAELRTDCPNS